MCLLNEDRPPGDTVIRHEVRLAQLKVSCDSSQEYIIEACRGQNQDQHCFIIGVHSSIGEIQPTNHARSTDSNKRNKARSNTEPLSQR